MNREQLDTIVKQALFAYSASLLVEVGRSAVRGVNDSPAFWIKERERTLKLLTDDAERGKIVDAILKEMTP